MLNQLFPCHPVQAHFEFAPVATKESSRVVQDAAQLAAVGVPIDPKEISEKTGYQLAEGRGVVGRI